MKKIMTYSVTAFFLAIIFSYSEPSSRGSYEVDFPNSSAELGAILFKDSILSSTEMVSCASCHHPDAAFADTATFSTGIEGHLTGRNTPSAMYLSKNKVLFWDGRAASLEQQAAGPIANPKEMNLPIHDAVKRLNGSKFYLKAFSKLYGKKPDSVLLLKAIADFEKTLTAYDSPYDHFLKGEDALSTSALRGFTLFFRRNSCANTACHSGINFGSDSLVNIGIYSDHDKGLYELTHRQQDIGKFRSVSLRNIAVTAPYMHNGKHKTLREVINYYNDIKNFPLSGNTHPDVKRQRERPMTNAEITDLIAFLEALTDSRYAGKIKQTIN